MTNGIKRPFFGAHLERALNRPWELDPLGGSPRLQIMLQMGAGRVTHAKAKHESTKAETRLGLTQTQRKQTSKQKKRKRFSLLPTSFLRPRLKLGLRGDLTVPSNPAFDNFPYERWFCCCFVGPSFLCVDECRITRSMCTARARRTEGRKQLLIVCSVLIVTTVASVIYVAAYVKPHGMGGTCWTTDLSGVCPALLAAQTSGVIRYCPGLGTTESVPANNTSTCSRPSLALHSSPGPVASFIHPNETRARQLMFRGALRGIAGCFKYAFMYMLCQMGLYPFYIPRSWTGIYMLLALLASICAGLFHASFDPGEGVDAPYFCDLLPQLLYIADEAISQLMLALPLILPRVKLNHRTGRYAPGFCRRITGEQRSFMSIAAFVLGFAGFADRVCACLFQRNYIRRIAPLLFLPVILVLVKDRRARPLVANPGYIYVMIHILHIGPRVIQASLLHYASVANCLWGNSDETLALCGHS